MSAISYYSKLKMLWEELQIYDLIPPSTCGSLKAITALRERAKLYDFLMGLDEAYNVMHSQILGTDPLPSLGKADAMVAEEEVQ